MSAKHAAGPFVLLNPLNGLIWSRHNKRAVSESSGDYTTYATHELAKKALRCNEAVRLAGFVIAPEPARAAAIAKMPAPRKYSEDFNESLAFATGFREGFRAGMGQESGQPERELVALLKDVLHCSDVFYSFRPDLHARLLEFGRQLRQQTQRDEFREVEPS